MELKPCKECGHYENKQVVKCRDLALRLALENESLKKIVEDLKEKLRRLKYFV